MARRKNDPWRILMEQEVGPVLREQGYAPMKLKGGWRIWGNEDAEKIRVICLRPVEGGDFQASPEVYVKTHRPLMGRLMETEDIEAELVEDIEEDLSFGDVWPGFSKDEDLVDNPLPIPENWKKWNRTGDLDKSGFRLSSCFSEILNYYDCSDDFEYRMKPPRKELGKLFAPPGPPPYRFPTRECTPETEKKQILEKCLPWQEKYGIRAWELLVKNAEQKIRQADLKNAPRKDYEDLCFAGVSFNHAMGLLRHFAIIWEGGCYELCQEFINICKTFPVMNREELEKYYREQEEWVKKNKWDVYIIRKRFKMRSEVCMEERILFDMKIFDELNRMIEICCKETGIVR